ncbi:MAG TPA: HAMP domain-containing sensor histidine kinase [Clostridia bacterium]|nr:HAMP domain-containing sensor histidine kinase [Clostridia bacterium]
MKLFTKIFLCTIAVITAALSVMGYLMISDSFANAVTHESQRGLTEYQLLKFALQSGILSASEAGELGVEAMESVAQQTVNAAPSGNQTAVLMEDGSVILSSFPEGYTFAGFEEVNEQGLIYTTENRSGTYWLVVTGKFTQSGKTVFLLTARNITSVIEEKQLMQKRFAATFIIVLFVSAGVMLGLSLLLTAPIKCLMRSTRRFAKGKYDERAAVRGADEIGELSHSFNRMASTIQDTIQQLELNAQQKEDFVANFAHELKTPLTSVIGYADMIYQRNDLTHKEIKEAAGYIVNEGMRLEALSQKLMELIVLNKQDFTFTQMRADEVVQDVADTLRPLMDKKGIRFIASAQSAYIRIEFDLFKTLLLNLIDNAVKADGKHIMLSGKLEGNRYVLSVTDDGRGIPKDQLNRITDAFYMVDKSRSRSQHGAGLGLAIASRIAALHGTQLVYQSEVGVGTVVIVALEMEDSAI